MPAAAAPTGSGCNGATLQATTLPWVDATFRATGTGLPPSHAALPARWQAKSSPRLILEPARYRAPTGPAFRAFPDAPAVA